MHKKFVFYWIILNKKKAKQKKTKQKQGVNLHEVHTLTVIRLSSKIHCRMNNRIASFSIERKASLSRSLKYTSLLHIVLTIIYKKKKWQKTFFKTSVYNFFSNSNKLYLKNH